MVGSRVTEECICGFAADTLAVKAPLVSCLLAVGYRWGYGVLCARGYGDDSVHGLGERYDGRLQLQHLDTHLDTVAARPVGDAQQHVVCSRLLRGEGICAVGADNGAVDAPLVCGILAVLYGRGDGYRAPDLDGIDTVGRVERDDGLGLCGDDAVAVACAKEHEGGEDE